MKEKGYGYIATHCVEPVFEEHKTQNDTYIPWKQDLQYLKYACDRFYIITGSHGSNFKIFFLKEFVMNFSFVILHHCNKYSLSHKYSSRFTKNTIFVLNF
jgi:CRISPR/Cas system-associated protein Csx1